jgi:hypothetical protein
MTTHTKPSLLPTSTPLNLAIRVDVLHTLAFLTDNELSSWFKDLVAEQADLGHQPPAKPMGSTKMRQFYAEVQQARADDETDGGVFMLAHSPSDDPPGGQADTHNKGKLHLVLHKFGWTHG